MNLEESIRRILRENNYHTNLIKSIIDSYDVSDCKHFCGVDIITPEERDDRYNYLNKDRIPYLIKVYFVGGPNSEVWPRTQAVFYKELDLMDALLKTIELFVPFNIEIVRSYVKSCDGYDWLIKRKYTTDDLQESIRRVLGEELYSPSGDEHIPSRFVVHKSNPVWRENIELTGLQISVGECYQQHVGGDVECKKSIFATDSSNKKDWFDSTYDDDIWLIDTECAGVTWYKDRHFESDDYSHHIVTFEDISPDCLKLIYKGTGSGDVEKWDKDSPNIVRESIKKVLKEETRFNKMGEEKYKSCSMSDITRMELIDTFLTNTKKDPQFNLEEPNYDMLIDDWDGYDDQVYIQNKLDEDRIIFYEGWVYSCWEAIKTKSEYKGMNKREVIESIIRKRFPRIAEEFNMVIEDYGYFNEGDGYIMYVILKKNMNLQESIKKVLKEETEDTSLRDTILRSIKSIGVEITSTAVGGFKNLCKILNINSPMDYLHLFDDLKIIPLSETELSWEFGDDPDVICYGYNPDNIIFIHFTINYNHKSECRISYEEIWKILAQEFELTLKEIKELTKEWLNSVYDLQVTNTTSDSDL